jgi:predicted hydrocarbon binding protein
MANIRGSALIPRVAWLKQRHAETWPKIVEAVQPATREMLEMHPIATGWYPFDQFVDLLSVADRVAGTGDLELVRALGHHAATANLNTILRVFIRFGSPGYILNKAAKVWSMYHDTGRGVTEPLGDNALAFSVYEHGAPHKVLCVTLVGWTRAYVEAAGGKSVKVHETRCRLSGGDCCRFEAMWD